MKLIILGLILLLFSGCASYGIIDNKADTETSLKQNYSLKTAGYRGTGDLALMLAFSGGGTRAAALAYGVLLELRDTIIFINGQPRRMLDEVDVISSVSGGSFTSAYFGLFGDRIFDDFEDVFLKRDIQSELIHALFNPLRWFSKKGRTEMAIDLYQRKVFRNKTFADMKQQNGPLILINASDLGYGVRFSFIQEFFSLLCSNIDPYPIARAVAASSAVPVLFDPVVIENYAGCDPDMLSWLESGRERSKDNPELLQVVEGLETFRNKDKRKYVHFVDGGITDNLGLRAIYEVIEVAGGAKAILKRLNRKPPRELIVISVNASTDTAPAMDQSNIQPTLEEAITRVSATQIHRYSAATLELMENILPHWAKEISTPAHTVKTHFIQLGFKHFDKPDLLQFFNLIPTSFRLDNDQVDKLIDAGRQLIRNSPDFQRVVAEFGNVQGTN